LHLLEQRVFQDAPCKHLYHLAVPVNIDKPQGFIRHFSEAKGLPGGNYYRLTVSNGHGWGGLAPKR